MKLNSPSLLAIAIGSQFSIAVLAQSVVVDWDQRWNYLHPVNGQLPVGSGTTTPHPEGTTPWFAEELEFQASYTGPSFVTGGFGFEAGRGAGPLGYGSITYFTGAIPPPAEFTRIGTDLSAPPGGQRRTAFFRTTFTVPDDGNIYINPIVRYIFDDGGFVYLDGEMIMRVNVGPNALDDFEVNASGTANTESQIRTADLSLLAGSSTGGNTEVTPAITPNATIVQPTRRLLPGTHTLAVSLHNSSQTSSDLFMALQLQLKQTDCFITAEASATTRDFEGTPEDPYDDTFSTDLTVTSEGSVGAGWIVTGPVGSSLVGQTGPYDTPVTLSGIPLSEFASGNLVIEVADQSNSSCLSSTTVVPQRIIASNDLFGFSSPIATTDTNNALGWIFDDATRTATMNRPGGDGSRYLVSVAEVDTSGQPDIQFSGILQVDDTSTGTEEEDEFVAYLILDGDTANPVNLITRHDLLNVDGLLTGDELAPGAGTFMYALDYVIPAEVNSAKLVFEGINNSLNETFIVRDLSFAQAEPQLQAFAGPVVFNNQGTPNPADDTFSAPIFITPVNLGASTGWTSPDNPGSGFYANPGPVTFGPFLPFTAPYTVTVADSLDPSKTAEVELTLDLPNVVVTGPTNVIRVENGPGMEDDTVTFDLEITGTNGGPGWDTNFRGLSPRSSGFGLVTFTIPAPLTPGPLTFEIADISYSLARQLVTVQVPDKYIIGQSDLSGTLVDITTNLTIGPDLQWINDPLERTLSLSDAGTTIREVVSETLDLSAQNEVFFSARLRAVETSTSSNFEPGDQFNAQLVYTVGPTAFGINLISPLDVGNGAPATTGTLGGANGPPNGFLNGYSGAAGTDLEDGTIYATAAEDYAAHVDRDELNPQNLGVEAQLDSTFIFNATIPAEAESAFLIIRGVGVNTAEQFIVSDILFSTTEPAGDRDGDGMLDEYEIANELNPFDASDRDLDLDGDGRSNYMESVAGTAANDPNSALRIIDYNLTDTTGSLTWSSIPGRIYQVQFSTDLENWTNLPDDIPAEGAPATETASGEFPLSTIGDPETVFFRVNVVTK
jgi:hypothetical protein